MAYTMGASGTTMSARLVYPASKKKALMLLLGSAVFVALGVWLRSEDPFLGWFTIVCFGLGLSVSLTMFVPNTIYLSLDEEGFELSSPIKKYRIRWSDVEGFELARIQGVKMIAIHYRGGYEDQRFLRTASTALTGLEGGIANNYAAPLREILQSLREWHARYRSSA
jgi:hypothetical protein